MGGYALEHKYSRVSYQASKNYYQLMQIAHLINQLMINSTRFQKVYFSTKNHPTLKNLWQNFIAAMKWTELDIEHLQAITVQKIQFRFIT
jgi:coenzyme F420-reducing hydrogenase delta subunit